MRAQRKRKILFQKTKILGLVAQRGSEVCPGMTHLHFSLCFSVPSVPLWFKKVFWLRPQAALGKSVESCLPDHRDRHLAGVVVLRKAEARQRSPHEAEPEPHAGAVEIARRGDQGTDKRSGQAPADCG